MAYSRFVEACKRNYDNGVIEKGKVDNWLDNGAINQEEYDYIVGEQ